MIDFKFLPKFSLVIVTIFIVFTIVGTLLHEFGHITVAKFFGYKTELYYGSTSWRNITKHNDSLYIKRTELIEKNLEAIKKKEDFEDKATLDGLIQQLNAKYPNEFARSLWITSGGPIQTILTSIIGLLILFYRKSKSRKIFKILDWLGIFLALFILREVFNFVTASYSFLFGGKSGFSGDEFKLSRYFFQNEWVIPSITLVVGMIISLYVIFKIIPNKYRFTFIVSGLIGGIAGFLLWFSLLGPLVLPK